MSHLLTQNAGKTFTREEAPFPVTKLLSLAQLYYISEECARQNVHKNGREGAESVFNLGYAWQWAEFQYERNLPITEDAIQLLGHYVEPEHNQGGWRGGYVIVGGTRPPAPQELPMLMYKFVQNLPSMSPGEAYKEFEMIHPFIDGNGRVGKVLYNWIIGKLHDPEWPPNFWGVANP